RRGRISKPRPSALSCAALRGDEVPTMAPFGTSPSTNPSRATSASRASSRGGMAALTNRGSSAVGKSLYECTAISTWPAWMASRSAAVKTPTPMSGIGSEDRSPSVLMITSSEWWPLASNASRMAPAWVVARKLPRVPIRVTATKRVLSGLCWYNRQFARGRDGVKSGLVELEQLAQCLGVAVAAGSAGQLLDAHGGCVQQLVDDAAHRAGDLVSVARFKTGQPVVQSEQFGLDDVGGTLAQRGDRRRDFSHPLSGQVGRDFGGNEATRGLGVGFRVPP